MSDVPGIAGYDAEADRLCAAYDAIPFTRAHQGMDDLIGPPDARVLDIGAGSGRDAIHLAARGHAVTAVEPSAEMRAIAQRHAGAAAISWRDAALPDLTGLAPPADRFELILITAVWMHLDYPERARAMPVVAGLMAPGARLILTLRHGPTPVGRRMFAVEPEETVGMAAAAGLSLLRRTRDRSVQPRNRAAGVTWTRLAFVAP